MTAVGADLNATSGAGPPLGWVPDERWPVGP